MNSTQFTELLLQSLEHERGGIHVYQTAIKCAVRDDLRNEWNHTQGWCRELWLESLGIEAQLPPPEEVEDVTTAVEAQEAKQERLARH